MSQQFDKPVSVLVATRNRVEPLAKCIQSVLSQSHQNFELLVLDDASDVDIEANLAHRFPDERITWMRSKRPSGVAGARNKLVEASASEILIFLDDDAYFEDKDAIEKVVNYMEGDSGLGIVAFKITLRGEDEGELQVPFTRRSRKENPQLAETCQNVSYFVGAAHAIRREVFDRCGLYQNDLMYGHEELDLSYAAIQQGFQIVYATDVAVSHVPGKSVINSTSDNELYYNSRNRFWVAYKHLPMPYMLAYVAGWTAYYSFRSAKERSVRPFFKGVMAGIGGLPHLSREPLHTEAVSYIKSNHGRLWY